MLGNGNGEFRRVHVDGGRDGQREWVGSLFSGETVVQATTGLKVIFPDTRCIKLRK